MRSPRNMLGCLVCAAVAWHCLPAQGTTPPQRFLAEGVKKACELPGSAPEPRQQQVLVLTNEDTVTGRIIQADGRYRVQGSLGETAVPASQVLKLCDTLEEAHGYLRNRANLRDPDERIRLARWCVSNNLLDQARDEAEAALKLRPGDPEAERLVRLVAARTATPVRTPTRAAALSPAKGAIREPKPLASAAQEHDYPPETLIEYTRRIQPIVLNGCGAGSCHGSSESRGYQLARPTTVPLTALQTRQNLANTLALVDRENADASPLLRKALEKHGGAGKPPLGGRDNPAYQSLEAWVKKLAPAKPAEAPANDAASESTATGDTLPGAPSGFATDRDDPSGKTTPKADAPSSPPRAEKNAAPAAKETAPFEAKKKSKPVENSHDAAPEKPLTGDPFDPELFNQQFHKKANSE